MSDIKEIAIVDHGSVWQPNGYWALDAGGCGMFALCDECARENQDSQPGHWQEGLDTENWGPIGYEWGETDTPQHCYECEALIVEALTSEGVEYVRDALESADGRPEVLAAWREAYQSYL